MPLTKILLHTDELTPRFRYVADFLCRHVWNMPYELSDVPGACAQWGGRLIHYTRKVPGTPYGPWWPASGFLSERSITPRALAYSNKNGLPYLSIMGEEEADPFALLFLLLSRYEEYLPDERDAHGRFPAAAGLGAKYGFLQFPLADAWSEHLRQTLNTRFPQYPPIPQPAYEYTPTYDIDHARAYCWKGLKRSLGGGARDSLKGRWSVLGERLAVWANRMPDPYDTFAYFRRLHERHDYHPIFFWLLGDYGPFDKNPHWRHPRFQRLIRMEAARNDVGIHPSYASFLNRGKVAEEVRRLEHITGKKVTRSRFHFLRFRLPQSYRMLLDLGITSDYSMAYPDAIGFRAGTSHAFPWYDLERETATDLLVHPFQIMDVTLKHYAGWDKEKSRSESEALIRHVKTYGGRFTSLWHNSSLDKREWAGWAEWYEALLKWAE